MITVVEDRVLARIALESVGWNCDADPHALADIAHGQAVIALRVLGIQATPEVSRAVAEDIAAVIADPDLLARARATAMRPGSSAGRLAA